MKKRTLTQLLGGLALIGPIALSASAQTPASSERPNHQLQEIQLAGYQQDQENVEQAKPKTTESGTTPAPLINAPATPAPVISTPGTISSSVGTCSSCNTSCGGGCDDAPGWLMQQLQCHSIGQQLDCHGITARGWVSQGFTWNPDSPADRFNLPVTFNDRSNEYQMNQSYLILEKAVDTASCNWNFGGRVDFMYGSDYFFTEALGLELEQDGTQKWNSDDGPRGAGLYGVALPQMYAEVFAPIGNGVTVKAGHFYTIIGNEVVTAPDNFFYSHAYTMQYGEPFTHTGVLASTQLSDQISVSSGVTLGSDNFTNPEDTISYLGGVTWTSLDGSSSLAWALHTGDEVRGRNRYVQSVVASKKICNLTVVLQSDYGKEDNAVGDLLFARNNNDAEWYGLNTYLLYDINECLSAGLRAEWFRDDDHARIVGLGDFVDGGDYFEVTAGLNCKPFENLTIRPEVRWDWSDVDLRRFGAVGVYDDFSDKNQLTIGFDVIWSF